jgi:threonine/homoserine/homoserine lactone efflux protein
MSVGVMLGDLIFLTAVVLGLSVVAQAFGTLFMTIKYVGAAYLAYLAYKIWTSGILKTDVEAAPRQSLFKAMTSGLLVTLGNPKTMLFYLALLPTIVDLASVTFADYLLLLGITTVVLVAGILPYILLAAKARDFFRRPTALRRLNRVSAAFLGGTAGYIAIRAA